jgi:putative copper export protein
MLVMHEGFWTQAYIKLHFGYLIQLFVELLQITSKIQIPDCFCKFFYHTNYGSLLLLVCAYVVATLMFVHSQQTV